MIAVECNTDEYFIKSLGFNNVRHCKGKGEVIGQVYKTLVPIGLIDEDPGKSQPSLIKDYEEIKVEESIILLAHKKRPEYKIIKICPDLEGWFIQRARKNGIRLQDYNLTDTWDALHEPHIERRKYFQEFIQNLISVDKEIRILREWITSSIQNR